VSVLRGISVTADTESDPGMRPRVHVEIMCPPQSIESMHVYAGYGPGTRAGFDVYDAFRARELAQHFQGVRDELVAFAEAQERKAVSA